MRFSFLYAPLAAAVIAIGCGLAATRFSMSRRWLGPLSGIVLAAVTVFGLFPELRDDIGWTATLVLAAIGFAALSVLDRMGVSVCPSCQHGHGGARWLAAAIGLHAFVDGWAMTAAGSASLAGAMMLHKIPEGLALGAMTGSAIIVIAAESMTVVGGGLGLWSAPGKSMSYLLALAAGTFLFLALHAVARENRVS